METGSLTVCFPLSTRLLSVVPPSRIPWVPMGRSSSIVRWHRFRFCRERDHLDTVVRHGNDLIVRRTSDPQHLLVGVVLDVLKLA